MSSEGPNSPGAAADDDSVGTSAWSNATNIFTSNNTRATSTVPASGQSHYLVATDFGFGIPDGAAIDGIEASIERSTNGGATQDNRIRIVKGGAIGSSDKSASGVNWPFTGSEAARSYGAADDLWGETWTADDINAADFGIAISVQEAGGFQDGAPQVDHVTLTVHYTEAAGGGGSSAMSGMSGMSGLTTP